MSAFIPERILAGIDHEGVASVALDQARHLATAYGSELHVCHVVAQSRRGLHLVRPLEPDRALRMADEVFQTHGIVAPGASFHVRQGNPVREITALASEIDADLLVLGPHSKSPGDFLVGQSALRLVQLVRIPTLVHRSTEATIYRRILVAFDLSESARDALRTAVHWSQSLGASLEVVHVFEPPDFAYRQGDPTLDNYVVEDVRREEFHAVDEALASLSLGGQAPHVHRIEGDPRQVISDVALQTKADLVVVGTHGRTGLVGLLLGSVAEGLLRRAGPSVLVCPQPRGAE